MSASSDPDDRTRKLGAFPYVLSGLSFVPLFGIVFGLVVIVWGLATKRQGGGKLASIGAGGIGLSVVLYGSLFFFGFAQRGGIYDDLRTRLAQSNLNSLIQSVEFYHLACGDYPDSLTTLKNYFPKGSLDATRVFDPRLLRAKSTDQYFYYARVGSDHYYLRGVAPDGKPFSAGALVPQVSPTGHLGLLTDTPAVLPAESTPASGTQTSCRKS